MSDVHQTIISPASDRKRPTMTGLPTARAADLATAHASDVFHPHGLQARLLVISGETLRGLALAASVSIAAATLSAVPAMGQQSLNGGTATGTFAYASGHGAVATGDAATAIGQFSTANGTQATATGTFSTANGVAATATGEASRAAGTNATATSAASDAVGENATATGANSFANGVSATATGQNSIANGDTASAYGQGSRATGDGTTAIGQASRATATGATALGAGAQALAANSVAIGAGSIAAAPNTVSFGAAGSERRLTNVAAGINPTDAVNVSQLSSFSSNFQSQISSLQAQIGDNRTEARRGIAAAVATASAPMPSAPGKTTWQIRGSTFQSEAGFGFGFAHRLKTGVPLSIVGGYGNGGGTQHTAYVGVGGEF
jgi:trimeric autotransporter adhesin